MAVKARLTSPGAALRPEGDARYCVEIQPDELKWPVRFYFLRTDDDRWANIGLEIGSGPIARSRLEDERFEDEPELTPSALRWLQENLFHFRELAESFLNREKHVRPKGKGHANSPEWLAHVAAQYRDLGAQRGSVAHLAALHGVSRTTVWRWLKQAERDSDHGSDGPRPDGAPQAG